MAKQNSLSIVYEEQEPRPTIPVSGAIGSPSPDASMVFAHLYAEFATVPAMEEHPMDGTEGEQIDLTKGTAIKRGDITRKVLATLVLSPEAAVRVGQWLMQKGRLAMENRPNLQP